MSGLSATSEEEFGDHPPPKRKEGLFSAGPRRDTHRRLGSLHDDASVESLRHSETPTSTAPLEPPAPASDQVFESTQVPESSLFPDVDGDGDETIGISDQIGATF